MTLLTPITAPLADAGRRRLLRSLFLGLGAASLPGWFPGEALAQAAGGPELDLPLGPLGSQDFGPLELKTVSDPFGAGAVHNLWAPAGFDVRVVMRHNRNPLDGSSTGTLGHLDPDGGGVFMQPDGGWIYASNSEEGSTASPVGGVGALRFNAAGELVDYYRICSGTRNNCAGGVTPWGTWISCEEVTGGYCYETDPTGVAPQRRLDALGARNGREAIAIDPIGHACYQTLDSGNQPFVRFVSNPDDLEVQSDGSTRMRLVSGISERLQIPAFGELPGYIGVGIASNATENARLRNARPYLWVADTAGQATLFNGGEGIWYHEIPEALRSIPAAGTVPTRRVMIFATKNDGRVWALDLDNQLIELLMDGNNGQAFDNLNGAPAYWNQVDNVVISPQGDALVAEDGNNMRLAIVVNNQPGKLLMQITGGGSEITGPAFTADGAKLYFSRQNGPNLPGTTTRGTTYEMSIPPRFRRVQKAAAFSIRSRDNVAPGRTIVSDPVLAEGFLGPLTLSVSLLDQAEFSIDDGPWQTLPAAIEAGQRFRVRHVAGSVIGAATETTVTIGGVAPQSRTSAVFRSITREADGTPDPFDFGDLVGVPSDQLVESAVLTLSGYNLPLAIVVDERIEYRINGGGWTREPGTLEPEDRLQVRHRSNRPALSVRESTLTVGGVTGRFRTRTDAGDRPVPGKLRG